MNRKRGEGGETETLKLTSKMVELEKVNGCNKDHGSELEVMREIHYLFNILQTIQGRPFHFLGC